MYRPVPSQAYAQGIRGRTCYVELALGLRHILCRIHAGFVSSSLLCAPAGHERPLASATAVAIYLTMVAFLARHFLLRRRPLTSPPRLLYPCARAFPTQRRSSHVFTTASCSL